MLQKLIVIFFALSIASCATAPQKNTEKPELTGCPEQRPQICTREYIPVCAARDTGIRCVTTPCPSSEEKTYSNGCTACSDAKVLEYRAGACEQVADKKLKQ